MSGQDADIVIQTVDLFADPATEKLEVSSRQVGPAGGTRKKGVPGEQGFGLRLVDDHAVRRVPGEVGETETEAIDLELILSRKHVVDRKFLNFEGHAPFADGLLEQQIAIKVTPRMDRYAQIGDLARAEDVVEMLVG